MTRQLLIALLAACGAAAGAQPAIYRCGSTYSEKPCANGSAVEPVRAAASGDISASRKETERQAKAADAMEKARLKEEAKPVAAYIPKEKAEAHPNPKLPKPEVFTATSGAPKKAKSKSNKKSE
jgi:hypothetical protein